MRSLINYFVNRPVIANVVMFGVIISAVVFWGKIGKEEMPEFSMNHISVSVRYPGASAEDVELFITKPIEEKLKGVTALDTVSSNSSYGRCTIRIVFESNISNLSEKIQELKDTINSVDFPKEADNPVYRHFKSSEKAIIEVGVFLKEKEILDIPSRIKLQKYVLALKNKILSLDEISGVEPSGYLRPELQVKVDPEKLKTYEISMNQVKQQIIEQHIRKPIGNILDKSESEISIISELIDVESLNNVIITSGFQGQGTRLANMAVVENGFEKSNSIIKTQGHEAIVLNIQKSSNSDIISAQKKLVTFLETFKKNTPLSPIDYVLIDDESYDVRNRLSLIGTNGILGFILIAIILLLFLDFKSGVWVAMGIPFSLAFTLVAAMAMGYTVNNMTLAGIIIVLGMVVDDAIIIAENISRKAANGSKNTVTDSTYEVMSPVIASVLTTCAAFIPLYFFTGHFGLFVKYIPTVIFLMLLASLLESAFILPTHMSRPLKLELLYRKLFKHSDKFKIKRENLIRRAETFYALTLTRLLPHRTSVLVLFLMLILACGALFKYKMKYVMFPREESRDFRVNAVAPEGTSRYEMAKLVSSVENIFLADTKSVVTSVGTRIAQNRRGGAVRENEASIRVEIVPLSERKHSLKELLEIWQTQFDKLEGFTEIKVQKRRFGSDSGSPILIEVQENNDADRKKIIDELKVYMDSNPALTNVEIEKPVTKQEYKLLINKKETSRLGINFEQLSSTLRSYVEGDILYTLNDGEEEVDIRFSSEDNNKNDINKLLTLTVANKEGYLVPIKGLVKVAPGTKPANITRINFKRTTSVYADLQAGTKLTPLEIAGKMETEVFPKISTGYPGAVIKFRGEVEDSRDSQSDFLLSVIMVLAIIYILLVFLFDSIWPPLLIAAIIPFGVIGVIIAFWLHGMAQYGFFAVVGTLGMIGVVINDSIVLINSLESSINKKLISKQNIFSEVSQITSSRLRAVVVTTLTTVAGLFPTAYGIAGYDSMLAEMMLAMGWGLLFGMFITLILVPCLYSLYISFFVMRRAHT